MNEDLQYLNACADERAALMALVEVIMELPEEASLAHVKRLICSLFEKLLDNKQLVCDSIDRQVLLTIQSFLIQERAVRVANSIANPENPM